MDKKQRVVLSISVNNHYGVLRRVASLFARRGYNIESLSVGESETEGVSRITVVVNDADEHIINQIMMQVSKLVEVRKVDVLSESDSVFRELALIKVKATKATRAEILEYADIFRVKVIDVSNTSLILEFTGASSKLSAFLKVIKPFGIIELVRTGLSAMQRGAGKFDTDEIVADGLAE